MAVKTGTAMFLDRLDDRQRPRRRRDNLTYAQLTHQNRIFYG